MASVRDRLNMFFLFSFTLIISSKVTYYFFNTQKLVYGEPAEITLPPTGRFLL